MKYHHGNMYVIHLQKFDKVFVIETLARRLKQNRELNNVQAITTAKVPIVKFTIKKFNLEGDISLYNTLVGYLTQIITRSSIVTPTQKDFIHKYICQP